jgi:hypothetical protein
MGGGKPERSTATAKQCMPCYDTMHSARYQPRPFERRVIVLPPSTRPPVTSASPAPPPDNVKLGILYVLASTFLFNILNATAK